MQNANHMGIDHLSSAADHGRTEPDTVKVNVKRTRHTAPIAYQQANLTIYYRPTPHAHFARFEDWNG